MKFSLTPKQKQASKALQQNTIVLYGGAIRGGKSVWGCFQIIYFCIKYPGSRWLIMRQSEPTLRRTLLVTFKKNFLDKGLHGLVKEFNQQTLTLTFYNGSQIIFMPESYDTDKDLNRFRGLEINGAFLDEANELQEATFDKVVERSGSWLGAPGTPIKIILTANPTNNWLKERIYQKCRTLPAGRQAVHNGMAYVQARIYDNPHVPAAYLQSLKMLPRYQYMAFVEGDWDITLKTGGEFYKCFELDKHVALLQYNPALPLHISWDDNVHPYLPCGIFQIEGTQVRMIDEITGVSPANTIKAVCDEIIRRYPAHNTGMFIYGDATANKEDTKMEKGYNFFRLILQYLRQYQPVGRVQTSNPSVVMRGRWLNTVLEKELDGIRITIGAHCKHTITDFTLLKEAADGTKLKSMETNPTTKVRYQRLGHFTDLFDYLMCAAFAPQFHRYQTGTPIAPVSFGKNNLSKNTY